MEIIEIHAVPLSLRHVDDSRRLSRNSLHEMIFKKKKREEKNISNEMFRSIRIGNTLTKKQPDASTVMEQTCQKDRLTRERERGNDREVNNARASLPERIQ